MGQSRPLFVYFRFFHIPIQMTNISFELYKLKKYTWAGIRTKGRRMVGAENSARLWRPPRKLSFFYIKCAIFFFIFVFSIQLTVNKCSINFANDWIWTADLWRWKRPLYQLSHNHAIFLGKQICTNTLVAVTRFANVHGSLLPVLRIYAANALLPIFYKTCLF